MAVIIVAPITPSHTIYVVIREICCDAGFMGEWPAARAARNEHAYAFSWRMMLFYNSNTVERRHVLVLRTDISHDKNIYGLMAVNK